MYVFGFVLIAERYSLLWESLKVSQLSLSSLSLLCTDEESDKEELKVTEQT